MRRKVRQFWHPAECNGGWHCSEIAWHDPSLGQQYCSFLFVFILIFYEYFQSCVTQFEESRFWIRANVLMCTPLGTPHCWMHFENLNPLKVEKHVADMSIAQHLSQRLQMSLYVCYLLPPRSILSMWISSYCQFLSFIRAPNTLYMSGIFCYHIHVSCHQVLIVTKSQFHKI